MIGLVVAVAVASVVAAHDVGTPSKAWRWMAEGVLDQRPRCSKLGRASVPSTCQFQVANPPVLAGTVRLDVRVHNTGASPLCYGLSIVTSYLAGIQRFCAKPGGYGTYVVTSPAKYYVDFELDVFVSVGTKDQPIAPINATWPSPFSISFSEARA